jgi:hypothetical protein
MHGSNIPSICINRFFVGELVWTPYNRLHDHLPARYNLTGLIGAYGIILDFVVELHIAFSMCRGLIGAYVEKNVANHIVDATAWFCLIVTLDKKD